MENILEIGGKTFKVVANFRMSYNLTKYRNKISTGFDFSGVEKEVVAEILKATQYANEHNGEFDMSQLSPEALKMLTTKSQKNLFDYEDIIDIMKILTSIEKEDEIVGLLDKEIEISGYDNIINKLTTAIGLVFMSAKDTSK